MNKIELSQILYALIKTYGKTKATVLFEKIIKNVTS